MKIILKQEAPLELVRIIDQAYADIPNINDVLIGIDFPELVERRALGAYDPMFGNVYIDMANCLRDKRWMKKGCLFIPNVWINLMFAVHHELIHACQILDDPQLIKMEGMPQELEDDANLMAQDAVWSWFNQGGKIPPLEEMGWTGTAIATTLDGLFATNPYDVVEELGMLEMGGAANVAVVVASHDHFNDIETLHAQIDAGIIGLTSKGRRYLTAAEFLAV